MVEELDDKHCGNPFGADLHDEVIEAFFSHRYHNLPPHYPARHMHVIESETYTKCKDIVVEHAFPRLCDGVATVLLHTSPKCLDDFLNPKVKVFEWRRNIRHVAIRRVGNEVLVRNMSPPLYEVR